MYLCSRFMPFSSYGAVASSDCAACARITPTTPKTVSHRRRSSRCIMSSILLSCVCNWLNCNAVRRSCASIRMAGAQSKASRGKGRSSIANLPCRQAQQAALLRVRQAVEGAVGLLVVGIGGIAADAQQHGGHTEGDGDLAGGGLFRLLEFHVAG